MAYTKQEFADGDILYAYQLSAIEDQMMSNMQAIKALSSDSNIRNGDSCSATIQETDGGYSLTIMNISGENGTVNQQTVLIRHGNDGQDGDSITVDNIEENEASGGYNIVTFTDGRAIIVRNGIDGKDGEDGKDGISPTVDIVEIDGGHQVIITDETGTKTMDVMDGTYSNGDGVMSGKDGRDGEDGKDGVGIASIEQTVISTEDGGDNILKLTLTDSSTSTFVVKNGSRGRSIIFVEIEPEMESDTAGIMDIAAANAIIGDILLTPEHNLYEVVDISVGDHYTVSFIGSTDGASGGYYRPTITRLNDSQMQISFQGSDENMQAITPSTITLPRGQNGTNGKDGESITVVSVEESTADGGNNVITLSDGTIFSIKNGSKGSTGDAGKTPVKGTDYWTDDDRTQMVNDVLASLQTWTGGSY